MTAGDLNVGQFFKTNECGNGNAFYALSREKSEPNKVRGQLVFKTEKGDWFYTPRICILNLSDNVEIIAEKDK